MEATDNKTLGRLLLVSVRAKGEHVFSWTRDGEFHHPMGAFALECSTEGGRWRGAETGVHTLDLCDGLVSQLLPSV